MDIKLLGIFIILNIVNVIIQTVKSIATVKCSKTIASIVNAVAYGLYTVVLVYTMCDLPLYAKALVVALCNLVGVFIVKFIEEKIQKERLWKVETTILRYHEADVCEMLNKTCIPYNYIQGVGKYTVFNIFCSKREQSEAVREILKAYNAKYFVSESKNLD